MDRKLIMLIQMTIIIISKKMKYLLTLVKKLIIKNYLPFQYPHLILKKINLAQIAINAKKIYILQCQ